MIFFTKKQLESIAEQLAAFGVKDSDFDEAGQIEYGDFVAIVQNGVNKKIDVGELGRYFAELDDTVTADNEDITIVDHTLKLMDRSDGSGYSGYKILRKNASFASQVTDDNMIYEVRYAFDLGGASVTIPENCTLKFNGGKLSNGTLVCQNTSLLSDGKKCVETSLVLSGTFASPLKLSLFGILGDNSTNSAIWKATTFPGSTAYDVDSDVVFSAGDIVVPRLAKINGNGHRFTFTTESASVGLLILSYRCFIEFLDVFCAQEYDGAIVAANGPYNSVHDFRLANMTISGTYNAMNDFNATGLKIYADNSQDDPNSRAITGCVVTNIRFEWVKHGIDIQGINYNKTVKENYTWMNSLFFSDIFIISNKEGILTYYKNNTPASGVNKPDSTGFFLFDKIEYQPRLKEYEPGYEPASPVPGIDGVHQSLLLQTGDFGFNTYIRDSISWDTSCFARVANGNLYTWNARSVGAYDNGEPIPGTSPVAYKYVYPKTGADAYSEEYGEYTLMYRTVKLYGSAKLFRDTLSSNGIDFPSDDYTQASGTQKFRMASSGQKLDVTRQNVSATMYLKNGNEAALSIGHARTQNNFYFANSDDSTRTQYFQWLAKNPGRTEYKILDFVRQRPILGNGGALSWNDSYDNKEVYGLNISGTFSAGSLADFKVVLKFLNSSNELIDYDTYKLNAISPILPSQSFSKMWSQKMDISNIRWAEEDGDLVLYFTAKALENVSGTNVVFFEVAYNKTVAAANVTTTDDGFEYVDRSKTDFLQNAAVTLLGTIIPVNTTSNRPTYSGLPVGYMYYDTTLNQPIWVKENSGGTITWVDATGATV